MSVPRKAANPQVVAAGLSSTIARAARPGSAQTPAVLEKANGRSQRATVAPTTAKVPVMETGSDAGSVVVFDTSGIQVTRRGFRLEEDASSAAPLEPETLNHPDFPFANGSWDDLPPTRAPSEDRASGSGTPSSTLWDLEKAILLQILPAISEDATEAYGLA
ncbi:hypothetical protein LTR74_018464 [Friedmanniomyces endolithicus]|nr:hypothetical protein LTR74_018464 [Friedmanniomyces endolithicus]